MTTQSTYLELKWTVSRGVNTYGYNICTVIDSTTGKRYQCKGGGYDMTGTSFGNWLTVVHQDRLLAIADRAYYTSAPGEGRYNVNKHPDALYGMTTHYDEAGKATLVSLDGACGLDSMRTIAKTIGLSVRSLVSRRGQVNGFTVEWEE
jgi:hypothetical protein